MFNQTETDQVLSIIRQALSEDIGIGDVTSKSLIRKDHVSHGKIIARKKGIFCGVPVAKLVYEEFSKKIIFEFLAKDGDEIKEGQSLCRVSGPTTALMATERLVLNFLTRLSGISTLTRKFAGLAKPVKILDTRKTTPNLRILEKYAVLIGGGHNHRQGLYDKILIKENHIHACGGIENVLKEMHSRKIKEYEIELESIEELELALQFKPPQIMLDNFSIENAGMAVKKIRKASPLTKIEISGGINLNNIAQYAAQEPDFISIGSLTTSSTALDMSFTLSVLI